MAQSSESDSEIYLEDPEYDFYNLEVTVAITEAEGEDIEDEFKDALSEIHGEKLFPCAKCDKVCKSKGGLTRHTNAKHRDNYQADIARIRSFLPQYSYVNCGVNKVPNCS